MVWHGWAACVLLADLPSSLGGNREKGMSAAPIHVQHTSAGLSSRHSMPRGPLRHESKATGMSSARGSAAISRTNSPSLQGTRAHGFERC